MVNRFERFSLLIGEISRCWHKISTEEMEKYGLNCSHAVYLSTLYEYADGITAAKLSELCGKNKSDVSRMIHIMEKKGLVKKECVHKNFYRARLKLTEEGRQAAEYVRDRAKLAVEYAGESVSNEHREIFYQVLGQISKNLQQLSKEGLPG